MKKHFFITAIVVVFLALGPRASGQSFSSTTKVTNSAGSKTLVRMNQISQQVTCFHDAHNCSSFLVEGATSKKFATSTYSTATGQTPNTQNIGYLVKDMEILDEVCWFCGEKWVETGQFLFTLDGRPYPEVNHYGFIGKFNINDILSGSGTYEIMLIPATSILTHLAVTTANIVAIGETDALFSQSCVVELTGTSYPHVYIAKKILSTNDKEFFMDIAWAGNKVVTLSRFKPSGIDSTAFKYRFGLRYGSPSNFGSTANTLYNYKTNKVFYPASIGTFSGLTPIFLSATNNGNGVVVSYLGGGVEGVNFFHGRLLMAHIGSIGASTVDTRSNYDPGTTVKYSEIVKLWQNVNTSTGDIHGDTGYDCVETLYYMLNVDDTKTITASVFSTSTSMPLYQQICIDGTKN